MRRIAPVLIAALLVGAAADAAAQGRGRGGPPSAGEPAAAVEIEISVGTHGFSAGAHSYIRDYYAAHRPFCPPGLAKKRNGCRPPGLAKKGYAVGRPLPHDVIVVPLPDDLYRHLPPPPHGHIYVEVDHDVLLVAEATKKVIDAVVILSGL